MKRKKQRWKIYLLVVLIFLCVYFYSFAYSALSSTVIVTGHAYARAEKDIRITDFTVSSSYRSAISSYEEFSTNSIKTNVKLPYSDSYIIYKVDVTNYGNVEMALSSLSGLPSNLKYEITNYTLKDKLCDSSGKCNLGSVSELYIKISYQTFNSSSVETDFTLNFDFQGILSVNYVGIVNNGYPTSITSGETLSIKFTGDVPPDVIPYVNGRKYTGRYTYSNGTLNVYNLEDNVTLMYLDKTYLMDLNNTSAFKSASYIDSIKSVTVVDYVGTSDTDIAEFDLSKNQDGSITGWIDSNYNLYIGSDWPIYADNLEGAFTGMMGVNWMDLRLLDTSQNTTLKNTFLNCQNLIDIDISTWDTSSVTTMEGLFYNCYNLCSVDLSNFGTALVTNMESMFDGCRSLEYLDLATFETSRVTNMRYMFYNCYNLIQVVVSYGWNTDNVTTSSSMFYNCQNLPNFNSSATGVSMAYTDYYGGYLAFLSEFCIDDNTYWGLIGSNWFGWIYSKYNIDGYVMDEYGMVYTDETYQYGVLGYSFDYGFFIYQYDDYELDFNACYGTEYVADAVG